MTDAALTSAGRPVTPPEPQTMTPAPTTPAPPPAAMAATMVAATPSGPPSALLAPGVAFGGRYHVIRLLGAGGMGAVYQAWDNELGVAVALKVIRPEVMLDPDGARDLERRFKRELLLARQVTHKNVVRIHDLGEIEGVKYITMPYIQGTDLATRLHREGRLPVAKVIGIARQVAQGLAAAHDAGVVHRDLKPANVMIDEEERAIIMDFGIARSTSGGATALGTVVGTLEYMAPEQAMGQAVDHRADIYTFGLIVYDLLLGRRSAARAESAVAELMTRMQRVLPPARGIDPSIPEPLDDFITSCMQPDPALRFQTMIDVIAALENLDNDGRLIDPARREATARRSTRPSFAIPVQPAPAPASRPSVSRRVLLAGVAAAGVIVFAGAGVLLRDRLSLDPAATAAPAKAVSVAVVPFRNATSNAALDWMSATVADMLRSELGQRSSLRPVSPDRLYQVLRDLRFSPESGADPATLRRVAEFTSAERLITGQYVKLGERIRIDGILYNARGEDRIPVQVEAASEADLLAAVGALAAEVQKALALAPQSASEIQAAALKPSSQSVTALRYYSEALQLARNGEHLQAVKRFEASAKEDPSFALAYAGLAQAHLTLGYAKEAEQHARQALALSERATPAERYAVLAGHARVTNDIDKAIDSYEKLSSLVPGDSDVHFELAKLYEDRGAFDRAREHLARVLDADPKFLDALLAMGRVNIWRGSPEASLEFLNRGLTIAIQFDNNQARASILQAIGVAYQDLGKQDEALRHFRESLEIKERIGDKRGIASSLYTIAQVQSRLGRSDEALKNFREALRVRREIGDTRGIGTVLIDLGLLYGDRGETAQALEVLKESLQIQRDTGNENYEALVLNNIGVVHLSGANYAEAQAYFERALALREKINVPADVAQTLHNLAETFVKTGQYDEALGRYLKALELLRGANERRGTAIELYNLGNLFEYQGRYGAALESKEEAVAIFRELKDRTLWMARAVASYGSALNQIGRTDESIPVLNEALTLAREFKNEVLEGEVLSYQGDRYFLSGEVKEAARLYDQAAQIASRAGQRHLTLLTRLNQAKAATNDRREKAAIATLRTVAADANRNGLKYLSVDASMYLGDALLKTRQHAEARKELEAALSQAERLGAKALIARGHYLLATALRASGDVTAARRHSTEAVSVLDELRKEARKDEITRRADLAPILSATN